MKDFSVLFFLVFFARKLQNSNVLLLFFYDKKREEAKEKNSITYYSPSSFVLWLAAAMFSGTIVVTVEKPQLPSSQFPFFWLECCWPKQYCTVMHFAYFLCGFYIHIWLFIYIILDFLLFSSNSNVVHEVHYVSIKLSGSQLVQLRIWHMTSNWTRNERNVSLCSTLQPSEVESGRIFIFFLYIIVRSIQYREVQCTSMYYGALRRTVCGFQNNLRLKPHVMSIDGVTVHSQHC